MDVTSSAHIEPESTPATPSWPYRLAVWSSAYAMLSGLATLAGWAIDVQRLTDWKNDGISMFPNTAVCAVLSGLTLLLHTRSPRRWRVLAAGLSIAVAAIGALTLFEHISGVDVGIDTLLSQRTWGQFAAAAPMRMGPPASTSFLLLGIALLLAGTRARAASAAAGVMVLGIAMLSLVGHLYGAQEMYTVPRLTGIAMQTASVILALGLGVLAVLPDRDPMRTILEPTAAGMLARRTLPLIVLLALALGGARLLVEEWGWVDTTLSSALRTVLEIVLIGGLLWRAAAMIRRHEHALRDSEAEMRRQAAQLATFFETAPIGLQWIGPDGILLWANDAQLKMLGYSDDEYIGHAIGEFHADQEVVADLLAHLRSGGNLLNYPAQLRTRDGALKSVLIDSTALWDDGRLLHAQCFTRDITDQQRIAAEREEANRRKDEFIAILAHELRNPLAPVRNAAQYLKLHAGPATDLGRPVAMIERQVAQMTRLIDDLLDVSRISRGTLELRRERVTLAEIVDAAVDACNDEIQAKGHRFHVSLPPAPIELHADRERLVQVLCNLIGNAAKYTPSGGLIELTGSAERGALRIVVRDNGLGIPADKLTDIFELFARVDHSLERQGGLGIGLTLARQIAELHGGALEARSAGLGQGSTFVLTLPALATPTSAAALSAEPPPASPPRRILVADDNQDAVESLAMLLELEGHHVHAVFDGEAALSSAQELQPEVALLDIGMPKANGYEVARRIRAQPWGSRMYLVALTGWGQDADKRRAREAGFDAHLVKPVPPEAISRLLANISSVTRHPQ